MEPTTKTTATVQAQTAAGHIEIDCPANVGPVGAFRTAAAAGRRMEAYADLLEDDDITGSMVFVATDNLSSDRRKWYIAALAYNREVRR